ncbi:MAG: beta-propeller fold lactonase family protein [Candidatus Nanopelagicales bacterium]|nr:beta-propeller fold lactonase family protein [Candidatus Nanopelagicales bacterium]
MINRLFLGILVAALAVGVSLPASADTTTEVWPVTQAFGVALSPDGETLWVSSGSPTNSLTRFRTSDGATEQVIDLTPADFPQIVAVSPDGLSVYVAAQNSGGSLSVVSATTNTVTRTINLGFMPTGIAVSSDNATIFVGDYFGNQLVAITPSGTVSDSVAVGSGPIGVAYSGADGRVYVSNQNGNSVSVIDVSDPSNMVTVGSAIPVASTPRDLAVSPDGREVWVPSQGSSTVSIIDTATRTVVDTLSAPDVSDVIAFSPSGDRAFVVSWSLSPYGYGTLLEFDVATRAALSSTALGYVPGAMAVSPNGQSVYVKVDGAVWVITFTSPGLSGENVPVAPLQQFELAPGLTCDHVPEGFVDFPGIAPAMRATGWGQSWATWAQHGTGGPICSRQPYFTSAGTWAVR